MRMIKVMSGEEEEMVKVYPAEGWGLELCRGRNCEPAWRGFRGIASWSPAVVIREVEDGYEVEVELPGVRVSDLHLKLADNVLTVAGERRTAGGDEGETSFLRRERLQGGFERWFRFHQTVDVEAARARYHDGILRLFLPKAAPAEPRVIPVEAGGGSKP